MAVSILHVNLAVVWWQVEATTGLAWGLWERCWHLATAQPHTRLWSLLPLTCYFFSLSFGGEGGKFSARSVPLQALFHLEMTCYDSGGPCLDGFGMLTALGRGQAAVTSEHRLAFWGKSLESLRCVWLLQPWLLSPKPGKTLQEGLDQPKTQLNHRSEKSPTGFVSFFVLSSKNLSDSQTVTCHSEAALCCQALVFCSEGLVLKFKVEMIMGGPHRLPNQSRKISSCNSKVAHDFNSCILCVKGLFWGLYLE